MAIWSYRKGERTDRMDALDRPGGGRRTPLIVSLGSVAAAIGGRTSRYGHTPHERARRRHRFVSTGVRGAWIATVMAVLAAYSTPQCLELADLLNKHVEALGGREVLDHLHTFSIHGTIETGTSAGQVQSWGRMPWYYREWVDLGPLTRVVVFDGTDAWTVDHNGFTRSLSGPEKAHAAVSSALALFKYTEPMPDSFNLEQAGEDSLHYILSLTYEGEGEHLLYIDKDDLLLTKAVIQHFGFPTEARFRDYRPVAGIMIPHQTVQSMGGTGLEIVVTVQEVQVNQELPDSLFQTPVAQVKDSRLVDSRVARDIPLAKVGSYLLAEVTLSDSLKAHFLIDSGSGATCLDSSLVRQLGLEGAAQVETRGVAGASTASFVKLASLSVPGARLEGQSVAAVDLASVSDFVGSGLSGILGWDFLSRFVVKLDHRRGTMSLYDPQTFQYSGPGQTIAARVQLNVPQVEAEVEGYRGWFVLDTGNGGSLMLHSPYVSSTGLMRGREGLRRSIIKGIGGEQHVHFGTIDSLRLGPYVVRQILAAFSTATEGFLASEEVAGNIGNLVLEQFTVYLDLPHERVILEPNELYDTPLAENLTGIVLTSRMGRVMIDQVAPGSPAEEAGVVPGSFLLEVGETVTDGMSPVQATDLLRRPAGSALHLRLEKHGVAREVELTIRPVP